MAGQDIALDPNGHQHGQAGPIAYWHVDDLKGTMAARLVTGAETVQDVKDVGGGKLTALVKPADGNMFGLLQSA